MSWIRNSVLYEISSCGIGLPVRDPFCTSAIVHDEPWPFFLLLSILWLSFQFSNSHYLQISSNWMPLWSSLPCLLSNNTNFDIRTGSSNILAPSPLLLTSKASWWDTLRALCLNPLRVVSLRLRLVPIRLCTDECGSEKKALWFFQPHPTKENLRFSVALPPVGIQFLTQLFNAALILGYFPAQWKVTQIILLLKPGKPPHELTSYRPISLLLEISKAFEKLLLNRIIPLVASHNLIPAH
jgi:hypothetical protein